MLDDWQLRRSEPGRDAPADGWTDAGAPGLIDGGADVDDVDWWQRCTVDAAEPTSIVFEGLTFPATVYLDGEPVADCESMFLPVRIDVGPGRHEVGVRFGSLTAWLATRRPRGRWRSSLVAAQGLRWARTTLLGRAPVYGAIAAPVGFWRPVVATPTNAHATWTVRADACGGVAIDGATTAPDGTAVAVQLRDPAGTPIGRHETRSAGGRFAIAAHVDDPRRWWPRGYGHQPVYTAALTVGGRETLRPFGFRDVAVTNDAAGFGLAVNGVPIFCRGVTWTPPDVTRLTVTDDVMRAHVTAFADAGANMVRVVGGLVYEQPSFWQCCAELGVMVWQDAMQATFDPPAEVSEVIARELAHVLDATSGNPALVIVSGGSETLQQPEMLGLDRAGRSVDALDALLPRVTAQHSDAHFVAASPSPPPGSADLAIRPDGGVAHWFGVGGYLRPLSDVRTANVAFAAECLAFANPPAREAVERHFGSAAVAGHHPDWKAGVPRDRGASWDFEDVRDFYAGEVFGEDLLAVRRVDPERYLQLGRLAIAAAMGECFGFWRRSDSGCSGALVLAAKDTAAGAGWGLLDVDGAPKAALAVLARVWAPVAVILGDDGLAGLRIDVHNDTARPVRGRLTLCATNAVGARVVDAEVAVDVAPHSSSTYADAELSGAFRDLNHAFGFGPPAADAVEARLDVGDGRPPIRDVLVVHPRPGQVLAGLQAVATRCADDTAELRISADVALRYVVVDTPGWATSDDVFHLAAGLPHTVRLTRTTAGARLAGTVGSIDLHAAVPVVVAP